MSNQSAINRSKSTKETQEQAVKQAQSQQYRHQRHYSVATTVNPYLFHTPLQSPLFDSKQTNADIVGIS